MNKPKGYVTVPLPSTDDLVHRAIKEGRVQGIESDDPMNRGVIGCLSASMIENALAGKQILGKKRKSLDLLERSK